MVAIKTWNDIWSLALLTHWAGVCVYEGGGANGAWHRVCQGYTRTGGDGATQHLPNCQVQPQVLNVLEVQIILYIIKIQIRPVDVIQQVCNVWNVLLDNSHPHQPSTWTHGKALGTG